MAAFHADYFDGRSSRRHAVEVTVEGATTRIRGEGIALDLPTSELVVRPRMASMPLRIALPGGALLVAPADAVAAALPIPRAAGLAHRLESHLGAVALSLVGIVVAGWFAYNDGVPWAAREIANRLPPEVEAELATESLDALDRSAFKPSALAAERRGAIQERFRQLVAAEGIGAGLHFRDGGWIGVNAFALPGGSVVLTDQLVEILDDDGVTAVLAHELGHLRHRHTARIVLQDSIIALASAALLGDVGSVASLAATVPTVMMHTGYSRDFEREADRFAFQLLRKTGRSPKLLGDALAKMEKHEEARSERCRVPQDESQPKAEEPPKGGGRKRSTAAELGYLSTHPATEERITAAEEAAKEGQ